jgi:hypothetical protein
LISIVDGSAQGTLRRLHLLYQHGYLDRRYAKRHEISWGGSEPLVYRLGSVGADVLKQVLALDGRRLSWLADHESDARESVDHALMVTEIMVRLEQACAASNQVRFIEPAEVASRVFGRDANHGSMFRWHAVVSHRGIPLRIEVVPDRVFGLQFKHRQPGHDTIYFFLEADRGTMPVKRKDLDRSSFHRKLLAYHASWRQMVPQQLFGFSRYRVLTVTSSEKRLDHLTEANQQFNRGQGSGLFLFTDYANLRSHADPLTLPFRSGRENQVSQLIEG